MSCWRWQSSFYLSCTSGEHGRARTRACGTCHSAFVTGQLHFCKYCVSSPIYDHKGAFVLGGCCVFVCGSTACCLWEQGRTTITERGSSACAWALWAVVWPDARLADGQSLTCYGPLSDYLVLVTHNRPLSLLSFFPLYGPAPHLSLMKPFPLVNSRWSSGA